MSDLPLPENFDDFCQGFLAKKGHENFHFFPLPSAAASQALKPEPLGAFQPPASDLDILLPIYDRKLGSLGIFCVFIRGMLFAIL